MVNEARAQGLTLLPSRSFDALATDGTFTRSEAERALRALIRRAHLPQPRTNARVEGVEVDAHWPEQRLIVEVDGFAFHRTRAAFERDRARDAQLTAAGFRVIRVTWRQLQHEPERVAATIAAALAR
jgi:very-short-patch-repair endonuclease